MLDRLIPAHAGKTPSTSTRSTRSGAHPRSRGENAEDQTRNIYEPGSSPLTRGKLSTTTLGQLTTGLIPAHAGKTRSYPPPCNASSAHPRSRGENKACPDAPSGTFGSSPLTRGKRSGVSRSRLMRGLIPAHAGKTMTFKMQCGRVTAHPRSRGENEARGEAWLPSQGSSPLTRGKPLRCVPSGDGTGLIPAHAGKTSSIPRPTLTLGAHPRSRGENILVALCTFTRTGSSPLTRGKQQRSIRPWACSRLIPAHAGKTSRSPSTRDGPSAHPRSRGENLDKGASGLMASGSSPLTRGKPTVFNGDVWNRRLIPAHAGKTRTRTLTTPPRTAHPRSRGENGIPALLVGKCGGSSPLTRGKLLPDR